jgi:hypothetical protein
VPITRNYRIGLAGGRKAVVRTSESVASGALAGVAALALGTAAAGSTSSSGDGVTYALNSTTEYEAVVVGDFPSTHGLHVDHSHPPRWFGAADIVAVQDGAWSDNATWDLGRPPAAGEIVHIPTKLTFSPGGTRKIVTQLLAVNDGGELVGDFSGVADPTTDKLTVTFPDTAINTTLDYAQFGNGLLVVGGKFTVKGKAKTTWGRLAAEVTAGQTTITLASAPTGWFAGDKVVIGDSRQLGVEFFNEASASHYLNTQFSVMTVDSVAGAVVTFTGAIPYDHKGAEDNEGAITFYPVALNLTRNVAFESENPAGTRGHSLYHGRPEVTREYLEFRDMGRSTLAAWDNFSGTTAGTNQQGRYPHHDHHLIGPAGLAAEVPQSTMVGCSIHNAFDNGTEPPRWLYTVHGSHYGLYEDCVGFNCTGSGFVTEDGDETGNTFDGVAILGVWSKGTGENSRGADLRDVAHAGSGFWFGGVENVVTNCFAGCCPKGYSVVPYMQKLPSAVKLPSAKGKDPYSGDPADYTTVHGQFRPMNTFSGNEAGGRLVTGIDIWKLGTASGLTDDNPTQALSTVSGLKVWHAEHSGFYNYMTRNLTFSACTFRNDFFKLRNNQGNGICFFQSDYVASDFRITNCDVQGFVVGFFVNAGLDGMTVTGGTWSNYRDFEVRPTWAAGTTAADVPARTLTLDGITFVDPVCDTFSNYGPSPQGAVVLNGAIHAYSANLVHDDIVYLSNHGGNDYRLYYPDHQGSGDALLQTLASGAINIIWGATNAGATNATSFALDGKCFGNKITPGGTTTLTRVVADAEVLP